MRLNWPWSRKEATSTGDLYKELLNLASSKTGIPVNWRTALQASTSFACGRVIAEGIAQVPYKLFKERVGGGMDPAKDHSLYEILYLKPNDWQTSFELREMIGLHLAFKNNAYIYKVRNAAGKILELLPFEPNMVHPKRNGWELTYQITGLDGKVFTVDAEDMWHIRGLSWDGFVGLDGIQLAREVIGLSIALETHAAKLFANGAQPGGILSTEKDLKEDQVGLIKKLWNDVHEGVNRAYKTAVLFGGLKWESRAQTGVDSQHIEQRRFQVEETCRRFRVMPIMVGQADKAATYASAEQMFLAHVVHCLMPWYTRIEQSADVNLLTEEDRNNGYYSKFMAQALMRGSSKERGEYFARALGAGGSPAWMTQDEVRGLEELNPKGGDAQKLAGPSNGAPIKPEGDKNDNPAS